MRRACLVSILALSACKPTVILEAPTESSRSPQSDPSEDPLIEQEAVREAVRAYAAALTGRDVEAAVGLVVPTTLDLYEDLRVAALHAPREQLEDWDLLSVIMILQVRSELSRTELEAVDGRGLFGFAVSEGLVGDEVESLSLDEVWVDDTGTLAQVRVEGTPVVWLRKTEAEPSWRVDLPRMIHEVAPTIEAMAQAQIAADGKVRTAYTLLEVGSDTFVDLEVLSGPLESTGKSTGEPAPLP